MAENNFDQLIEEKIKQAEMDWNKAKKEIAKLAEEGHTKAYIGEYGQGETYYSKNYVKDQREKGWDDREAEWLFSGGHFTPGTWIASSETC